MRDDLLAKLAEMIGMPASELADMRVLGEGRGSLKAYLQAHPDKTPHFASFFTGLAASLCEQAGVDIEARIDAIRKHAKETRSQETIQ